MEYWTLTKQARNAYDDINRARNIEYRTKENGNTIISIPIEDSTKDFIDECPQFIKDYWEERDYEYLGVEFSQCGTDVREDQWFAAFTLKEIEEEED